MVRIRAVVVDIPKGHVNIDFFDTKQAIGNGMTVKYRGQLVVLFIILGIKTNYVPYV